HGPLSARAGAAARCPRLPALAGRRILPGRCGRPQPAPVRAPPARRGRLPAHRPNAAGRSLARPTRGLASHSAEPVGEPVEPGFTFGPGSAPAPTARL